MRELLIEATADELALLFGPSDVNRRLLEDLLGLRLTVREGQLVVRAHEGDLQAGEAAIDGILVGIRRGHQPTDADVRQAVRETHAQAPAASPAPPRPIVLTDRGRPVAPKTPGQAEYVSLVTSNDLTFCIGPAGTGKTYLAMALAVGALKSKQVSRIILSRPIVEAGEALGFLPGDIMDKVDPYLRPLHDALHDIMGGERLRRHLDRGVIEVIPLAYMRGRTLNDSFVVLDEAQNTTEGQMKMALTRLGFGSKMVVTGDVTQTDLPPERPSGLQHALGILRGIRGIAFCELGRCDIVRHSLVQAIVAAYGDKP